MTENFAPQAGYTVVIPTLGRPTLTECLTALAEAAGPEPERIVVVDDRPVETRAGQKLPLAALGPLKDKATIVAAQARGPAAARNIGWRTVTTPWTVFLDDDVRVCGDWRERVAHDLVSTPADCAGVQGVLTVPLPADRRPTDWERNTAGLAQARWATADMAYLTRVLHQVGGFDERFPRAFREDADLALRVQRAGWRLRQGQRRTNHPVRQAGPWASVTTQRGNADDALMRRLHGPRWHVHASAPRGRIRAHLAIAAMALAVPLLAAVGQRRAAGLAAAGWAAGTTEFAWTRIAPGPGTAKEVTVMVTTSLLIPPLAAGHRMLGELRWRDASTKRGGLE